VLGSDTVCTSLLSSLRIVFEATPVVALLKCFDVQKIEHVEITTQSKISEKPRKGIGNAHHAGHTPGAG
jgi:predicted transcriptional regulator